MDSLVQKADEEIARTSELAVKHVIEQANGEIAYHKERAELYKAMCNKLEKQLMINRKTYWFAAGTGCVLSCGAVLIFNLIKGIIK